MNKKDTKTAILDVLSNSQGAFISGQMLAQKIGFSRASLWKHIKKLREEGYVIEAEAHNGYKLTETPDKFLDYEIKRGLKTKFVGQNKIFSFSSVSSTNEEAYRIAEKGALEGTIVIAESQSAGKGRMGRLWVSPKDAGIYVSLVLRPNLTLADIPGITLMAGASIVKTIKNSTNIVPELKWPNDVLYNGKKLCGILTEIKAELDMVDFIVLGIGININTAKDELPEVASSLFEITGKKHSRLDFLRLLFETIEEDYNNFVNKGFDSIREECLKFSGIIGKDVLVKQQNVKIEGKVQDMDVTGALILKTKSGQVKKVFSGDIIVGK